MNNEKVKTPKKQQKIDQNLRHGYIFLICTILCLFFISLGIEVYIRHNYIKEIEIFKVFEQDEQVEEEIDLPKITVDDIEDGYVSLTETLNITGNVDREAEVKINGEVIETYKVFGSKRYFDHELRLNAGENLVKISATDSDGNTGDLILTVIYEPDYYHIVTTSLECTTLKPQFKVGEKIVFDCELKDQDGNEIEDVSGSLTVYWDTGTQKYEFEGDDLQMIFEVPVGNSGKTQGIVEVDHELIQVSSHFIFIIED